MTTTHYADPRETLMRRHMTPYIATTGIPTHFVKKARENDLHENYLIKYSDHVRSETD